MALKVLGSNPSIHPCRKALTVLCVSQGLFFNNKYRTQSIRNLNLSRSDSLKRLRFGMMGHSQAVRHSTLTAALVGSNPTGPVFVIRRGPRSGKIPYDRRHSAKPNVVKTNADMVELADTPDLGSGPRGCRFKSCYPQNELVAFYECS